MKVRSSYRDLIVWQSAIQVGVDVYDLTGAFPKEERFGLSQQMRRAAVSVASNIAEGYGRKTHGQRYAFLETALGSTYELETQLELAARLGFAREAGDLALKIKEMGKGIDALMRYVERDSHTRVVPRPRIEKTSPRDPEEPRGTPRNKE